MPVTPERQRLYPGGSLRSPEWLAIRADALARADNRCMPCGAVNGAPHPETGSTVVLTTAHLYDVANSEWWAVKAMCQRCHNALDAPMRRRNAAQTRRRKMGNLELFG